MSRAPRVRVLGALTRSGTVTAWRIVDESGRCVAEVGAASRDEALRVYLESAQLSERAADREA